MDKAPNVGFAIATFGDEGFGGFPAGGFEFGNIGRFEFGDEAAVHSAVQFVRRRCVHAAPGIDEAFAIGRELDGVVAVALGKGDEAGPIQVNTVVMDEVGVLVRVFAAGAEPHLAVFFIDAVDAANNELAFGDLVFDSADFRIDKVEMAPAVAFGGVNHFIGFLEPVDVVEVQILGVGGPDEGIGFFIDDVAQSTGLGIDFNNAVALMAA